LTAAASLAFGTNGYSAEPESASSNFPAPNTETLSNPNYVIEFGRDGVTSFRHKSDTVSLFGPRGAWGDINVRYRLDGEDWITLNKQYTKTSRPSAETIILTNEYYYMPLKMERKFTSEANGLRLTIKLENTTTRPVEIGDISMPISWTRPGGNVREDEEPSPVAIFTKGFIQKHSISGNSSFMTFAKPSGDGPFYILMTGGNTPLEFFNMNFGGPGMGGGYSAYILSGATGPETEGTWRMPHSTITLDPEQSVEYSFLLTSAQTYESQRDVLYENGLLDIRVLPGYTLPRDLTARVAIRTKGHIDSLVAEHPAKTTIKPVAPESPYQLFDISFQSLGEQTITVYYNGGEKCVMEFFSTEPLETLVKKRSSFITNHQQHKAPGKWWDGLYSVYDMKYSKLRGPEDTDGFDGWWGYVLACDDPALGKAPYVAGKNAAFPDKDEIASLEYYVEHFVWGGLQRTDKETPYPYGIYGVPNWYIARDSVRRASCAERYLDKMKIWRSYDYPHITMMYFYLFKIASQTPQYVHYLDADGYFERAVQTAKAYFSYPYEILPWYETYKWGCYNEWIILEIIDELEKRGRKDDADFLRGEWEKKAKYFIYDDVYPFRSEYSFDRTAFESSYALAKYATLHPMSPDSNLWFRKNYNKWYSHPSVKKADAEDFMKRQHYAGLSVRGWLAPKYYLNGSDCNGSMHTHELTYMAMMGGWSILDYGLYFSDNLDWLELGYNSYLSSWALMNTGDAESNYGYWYPGKENDGASGWAFISAKNGNSWIGKKENRGVWRYDGEIDLGHCATFHTARTIFVDSPIFGKFALGGLLRSSG